MNTINEEVPKVSSKGSGRGKGEFSRMKSSEPFHGRGKGKGQGKGKGANAQKGKGNVKPEAQEPTCKFCGKRGHYDTKCWEKFPQLRPTFPKPRAPPKPQPQPTPMETEKTPEKNSKKRKAEVLSSLQGKCLVLKAQVNEVPLEAIIDTGATISVVSKNFVAVANIKKAQAIPIEVGNGQTIFTCGTTAMVLHLG